MTRTLGTLLALALVLPAAASDDDAAVRAMVATERSAIQADRQAIVAENLPLTDAQAQAFWPLYREYRGEMEKLGDRIEALVIQYSKSVDTMTDAQATTMLDEFVSIQSDEAKIKSKWVGKFRKVLPSMLVTRFYQIENKLDTTLRFAAAVDIPLVTPAKP